MSTPRALRQPLSLRITSGAFLALWCLIAAFPIFWITVMSFKTPVDAFDANPLNVIFGPATRARGHGLSLFDIIMGGAVLWVTVQLAAKALPGMVRSYSPQGRQWMGWGIGMLALALGFLTVFFGLLPLLSDLLNPVLGPLGRDVLGLTTEHYETVWIDRGFSNNFKNSLVVTAGVVTVSLTVGTLAGYGLARSGSVLAFWILIIALVFRALPHSVLVAGYLPVFISSAEWLSPILGDNAPTLYGKPWAVIAVLVAINQPFTIWMLRSFFQNIPAELDEAARVDGCNHFQAFRRVIMPVMWPGVITTGLFSFLLAYNDFLVTSLLLDAQNQTMVPAIAGMFNRETTTTDQVVAVAAAVSITAPLFFLVMVFQRQIVSGLTAGAVKG
ncbi:carbohydrate ABC transporter permease [Marinovum algicola]|uniref:Carbohydrate ABC transporter membrane protein 2, CUT1 family (TC 3.A.1.1.-) n=1 Tax=Marinovum algicola TaxID=42444 RepID=A0A975WDE2_9RHOB|nr:carbohydrate ABC transporter permease [Marinovum algicola]SEK00662.1 carbohydrate ABC transporter membrane protein 2, CUT1 family (TC 3.A.1.1.-) [Marinovum algicola]SLN45128.1 Trehalose transport system permease protein SugB [Marinovum algicola]